jgi:hypothetical protein
VLDGEELDKLANTSDHRKLAVAMLDLTNYEHDSLMTKSMEIIYRLFSAVEFLCQKACIVELITDGQTEQFATELRNRVHLIRMLSEWVIEEQDAPTFCEHLSTLQRHCFTDESFRFPHQVRPTVACLQLVLIHPNRSISEC